MSGTLLKISTVHLAPYASCNVFNRHVRIIEDWLLLDMQQLKIRACAHLLVEAGLHLLVSCYSSRHVVRQVAHGCLAREPRSKAVWTCLVWGCYRSGLQALSLVVSAMNSHGLWFPFPFL